MAISLLTQLVQMQRHYVIQIHADKPYIVHHSQNRDLFRTFAIYSRYKVSACVVLLFHDLCKWVRSVSGAGVRHKEGATVLIIIKTIQVHVCSCHSN